MKSLSIEFHHAVKEQAYDAKLDKAPELFKASPNELRVCSHIKAFMPCDDDSAKAIVYHLMDKNSIVKYPKISAAERILVMLSTFLEQLSKLNWMLKDMKDKVGLSRLSF